MENTFAIIEKGVVQRLAIADNIVQLGILLPEAELVLEVTEATGAAYVGAEYRNGKFVPFNSYKSWTWNEKKWAWIPPVAYPTDGKFYAWDEGTLAWIDITPSANELG